MEASCTNNIHSGEKSLCCCNFSRFVSGFFSEKVKKCLVYFALFEFCISRSQLDYVNTTCEANLIFYI